MSPFRWSSDKNKWLAELRGITFERVVARIESVGLLDVIAHPNTERYPSQRIMVVEIDRYAWLVPFVESDEGILLKTIIPSRKATRDFLEQNE